MDHDPTDVEASGADRPFSGREAVGLSLYGASVEYGVHAMLFLANPLNHRASSRDLAELLGVSPTVIAKIFPKLEKAGLVSSTGGINGGYRLTRAPAEISMLDMVTAIEGGRRLFDCKEVRTRCVLFGGQAPGWASGGVCGVHAVMLRAESAMRAELARTSLKDLSQGVSRKAPADYVPSIEQWLSQRATGRELTRITAVRNGRRRQPSGQ